MEEKNDEEKTECSRIPDDYKYAVRTVFRRREPDFPGFYGTDGRAECMASGGRSACDRRGTAAAGRGGIGHQPLRRSGGIEPPGGASIRNLFYLSAVFDHRPVFCHSPVCHSVFYDGNRTDVGGTEFRLDAGSVFPAVFPGCAVLLPAAQWDSDLGGEGAQPHLFGQLGDFDGDGPAETYGQCGRYSAGGCLCRGAVLPGISGGI